MIFFESNNKITLVVILAAVASIFIFNQWLKSDPFVNSQNNNSQLWEEIKQGTSSKVTRLIDNMNLGWLQLQDFEETVDKQNKQAELLQVTKEYLLHNKTYENQIDCEAVEGTWSVFGENDIARCRIATIDGGQECTDSSQCQDRCIVIDWPEIYQLKWSQGEAISMTGVCNDSNLLVGCFGLVEEGLVKGATCE